MSWVPIRVNLAGDGYTELLNHENGAAHFGAWIGLVEVGALCDPRGTLIRGNGKPHDPESLGRITRIPAETLAEAIPRLLSIGWLEHAAAPVQQENGAILHDAVAPQRKFVATDRQDNTETLCSSGDERGVNDLEPVPAAKRSDAIKQWFDSEFWPAYPRKKAKPRALKAARRHGNTHGERAAIMECLLLSIPGLQERFRADGDFRPYAASWLDQTPWADPIEERPERAAGSAAVPLADLSFLRES